MPGLDGLMNSLSGGVVAFTAIPFILVALFLLLMALRSRRRVRQSMNWERTTGTVLFSTVETRRSRSGRSGYSTAYYPKVVYEYHVSGQRYQSDRLNLGEIGLGFYKRVEAKVAEYPPGKMIDVYYDPDNPAQAVLERTAPSGNVLLFVVVVIVAILVCTTAIIFGAVSLVGQMVSGFTESLPR